jgi:hypothetical protein
VLAGSFLSVCLRWDTHSLTGEAVVDDSRCRVDGQVVNGLAVGRGLKCSCPESTAMPCLRWDRRPGLGPRSSGGGESRKAMVIPHGDGVDPALSCLLPPLPVSELDGLEHRSIKLGLGEELEPRVSDL